MTINKDLMSLVKAIVSGDSVRVGEIVKASPELVAVKIPWIRELLERSTTLI